MAMRFYETVWENILNRTVILSVLFFFWTILIESYFLFWPKDLIRANIFVGWLFTDIFFGFSPLIDIFHIVIWGALRMGIYQSYASEDLPFVVYRVSNRHLGKLLMVLASCREYGGQGFAFLTLRTSGTIASIKELETNEGTRSFFAESVKSGSLIRGKSKKLS